MPTICQSLRESHVHLCQKKVAEAYRPIKRRFLFDAKVIERERIVVVLNVRQNSVATDYQ